jgi:hypothetical protein
MVGFIKAVLICISVSTSTPGMMDKTNETTRCLPSDIPTLSSIMSEIMSENLSDINDAFFVPTETEESNMTQGMLILDATITSSDK